MPERKVAIVTGSATGVGAATALGLAGAIQYFEGLIQRAVASVPAGPRQSSLQKLVLMESERLVPRHVISHATMAPV